MTRKLLCLVAVLFLALPAIATDKSAISDAVRNAKFILVTTHDGGLLNPEISPDDRHAIVDIQKAIDRWGRFKLVYKIEEADLVIVIRRGRNGELNGGFKVGGNSPKLPGSPTPVATQVGGEVADSRDTFDLFLGSSGISGIPIWQRRAKDGLQSPDLTLFREFQSEVEKAERKKH